MMLCDGCILHVLRGDRWVGRDALILRGWLRSVPLTSVADPLTLSFLLFFVLLAHLR